MATILVVDDELGIRALLSEILSDEGHNVELAQNAQQARQLREAIRPDLVLLDIWMPDVDGVTLLKEWSAAGQLTMPVIMMSGHGTIDTAVEATKVGATAFLEKPITLQKLLRAVEQALVRPGSGRPSGSSGAGSGPASAAPPGQGLPAPALRGGVGMLAQPMGSGPQTTPAGASGQPGLQAYGPGLNAPAGYGAAEHAQRYLNDGRDARDGLGATAYPGGALHGSHPSGLHSAAMGLAPGQGTGASSLPPGSLLASGHGLVADARFDLDRPLREARDGFEKSYFEFHLAKEGGSMTRVAEKTGLERTHLYRKLKQLGVDLSRNKRGGGGAGNGGGGMGSGGAAP